MSTDLETAFDQLDAMLPDTMTDAEVQTLIHMICRVYGIEGRRLERLLTRMAKTCRRVEKQLPNERMRMMQNDR